MKKFISILLCFQFLVFPVSFTYASSTDVPGVEDLPADDPSLQEMRQYEGWGWDFVLKQLVILGNSIVAQNIWMKCYNALVYPSVYTMQAGAIAYYLTELIGAQQFMAAQNSAMEKFSVTKDEFEKKGNKDQKEALEAKLEFEKNLRDHLNNKKIWMSAISVVFMTAMIFAIIETATDKTIAALTFGGSKAAEIIACKASIIGTKSAQKAANFAASVAIAGAYGLASGFGTSFGQVSGWGQGLIVLLGLIPGLMDPVVDIVILSPIARSIYNGALFGLTASVSTGLFIRGAKSEQNVKDIKKVIDDFTIVSENEDDPSVQTGDTTLPGAPNQNGQIKGLSQTVKPLSSNCMAEDGSISSAACKNPRTVGKRKIELEGFDTLNSALSHSSDLANSLMSGNTQGAMASAASLNSMAGSLRKILKDAKKQLNDKLIAEGKEPIDFDKEIKKQMTEFQGIMNNAASSKGLPGFGQSPAGLATLDAEIPKPSLAVAAPVAAPAKAADKKPVFDLGLDDEETPQDGGAPGDVAKTGEGIDQFDANVADISNKTDVSIFVQLSNRYLLNYTKIFKKVEEKPKVETPKKEEGAKK